MLMNHHCIIIVGIFVRKFIQNIENEVVGQLMLDFHKSDLTESVVKVNNRF